jgi:hypothetical protein
MVVQEVESFSTSFRAGRADLLENGEIQQNASRHWGSLTGTHAQGRVRSEHRARPASITLDLLTNEVNSTDPAHADERAF